MGFGFMSGAFSLVNLLADANGPGTVGLVQKLTPESEINFYGDYKLFLTSCKISSKSSRYLFLAQIFFHSAIACAAFILLHVMWNVIFWHACYVQKPIPVVVVILTHFFVSGLVSPLFVSAVEFNMSMSVGFRAS